MKKIFVILLILATCLMAGCTGNDLAEMNYNREARSAKFQFGTVETCKAR